MPDTNTNPDTDTDADGDDEQDLKQRVKAFLLAAYAYVASALAQSAEEIAPQLRGLSLPGVSSRAAKSILLAGVLVTAAVAMPADPFGGGETNVETQDPVQGETYEPEPDAPSLNGATLNSLPDSFTGGEPDAPDPPEQIRASAGSQTMNVETAVVDGEPGIVLEDDRTHDGRWVSIDTSWFEEHLGEVPSAAFIHHETDGSYASAINVRGDSAAFYVREFSTNTVTFDGEISLSGEEAGDGSQFEYELNSTDGVENPSINLTGVSNADSRDFSVTDTGTIDPQVGGNLQPPETTLSVEGNGFGSRTVTGSKTGATDGYSTSLDLSGSLTDTSHANTPSIDVTGVSNTQSVTDSGSGSASRNVDGNQPVQGTVTVNFDDVQRNRQDNNPGEYISGTGDHQFSVDVPAGERIKEIKWEVSGDAGSDWTADVAIDGNTFATGETLDGYTDTVDGDMYNPQQSGGSVTIDLTITGRDLASGEVTDSGDITQFDVITETVQSKGATVTSGSDSVTFSSDGSKTIQLDPSGGYSISQDSDAPFSWDVDYTAETVTSDPTVTINGETTSYAGDIPRGETRTLTVSNSALDPGGSNSLSLSLPAPSGPQMSADLSWSVEELDGSVAPSVDINDDGTAEASTGEILTDGEEITATVQPEIGSSWSVSAGGNAPTVSATITEQTVTTDPVVELNGETVSYTGTLAAGETVPLSQNASALREGTNTVNISTNSPASGPASLVGFEYSHSAEATVNATVSETTWSQSTDVSRTWPSAHSNATAEIPMNDRVVDVRNVEVRYNSTTWQSVSESDYTLNGTDLTVQLGDVAAGATTEVRATGSKVRVADGAITVLDPTTGSETLDTRIQVDDAGPEFTLSVDETVFGDRVHYADNTTWGATGGETTISASGEQTLTLPNATAGAEATVRTWPVEVAPTTGQVAVPDLAGDRSEPGIAVRGDGNSEVGYTYVNAEDGQPYVLWSQTNEIVRDEGLASSPITLTDDNSDETLVFIVDEGSASGSGSGPDSSTGPGGAGPMVDAGGSVLAQLQSIVPSGQTLLLGVTLLGGLFVVGRRSGVITDERQQAATSTASSAAGTAGSLVERALDNQIVVGALILGAGAFILGTGVLPGDARLIVGLGTAPVAVYLALQQFGQFNFQVWAGSTIVIALLGMNVLAPTFFETIAQEAGIIIVIAGAYLAYRAISAWRAEAETPDEVNTFEVDAERKDGGN